MEGKAEEEGKPSKEKEKKQSKPLNPVDQEKIQTEVNNVSKRKAACKISTTALSFQISFSKIR